MKKYLRRVIGLMLVVAMTFTATPQVFAAQKKYISDMKISYDSDGKQKLIDAGYTVVKQNLNQDANTGSLKSNREVYCGYKTTTDPDDAITDIAMMSEECGYSFSDYQKMLKAQFAKYEILAVKEMNVIKEFRENYKNKIPMAVTAYETLNNFKEDDSGKLVGDYLLDESLTQDDLFKFITQISSYTLSAINNILAVGIAECTENNFFSRLSALSENQIASIKSENSLYDDAMVFYDQVASLKNNIKEAEAQAALLEKDEVDKADEEKLPFIVNNVYIATRLKSVKIGAKSLYDTLMDDNLSVQELYPLVKIMTPGQVGVVCFAGFNQLFLTTGEISNDEFNGVKEKAKAETQKPEVVSAYYGVDRSMFTDAVAVTSKATRKMSATGDSSPMWGNVASGTEIALVVTAAVSAVTAVAAATAAVMMVRMSGGTHISVKSILNLKLNAYIYSKGRPVVPPGQALNMMRVLIGLNVVMYVAIAVMVIVSTVLLVLELYNYYNPVYSKVPKILLDLYDDEDTSKYIRYDGVMGLDGEMGDVNGYRGKKWNALYVTKDKTAGKPIEPSALSFSDSTKMTDKNYKPVHNFGDSAPVNLNNYTFSGSRQIYLYFKQNLSYKPVSGLPGSIFSNKTANMSVVTGICGAAVGFVLSAIIFKRRKKEEIVEQTTTAE